MPVSPTYPGVYVQEEASGARAVAGVATSIAMFIGMAERGRLNAPTRIFNVADFERNFGAVTAGELARQVRNFYLNGGGQAYVMRIARNAFQADVTIVNESGNPALTITALDHGIEGNLLRAEIDYDTASPGETFNLTVFRNVIQADGTADRQGEEIFENLSMNPNAGNFADTVVNGSSALVTVAANGPVTTNGISIGGTVLGGTAGAAKTDLDGLVTATNRSLTIKVGNNPAIPATLTEAADAGSLAALTGAGGQWTADLNNALASNSIAAAVLVDVPAQGVPAGGTGANRLLHITSADGEVQITQGVGGDCTVALRLGVAQGGIEGSDFGDARPAPSGFVAQIGDGGDPFEGFREFAGTNRDQVTNIVITDDSPDSPHPGFNPGLTGGATPMFDDGATQSLGNAMQALEAIAASITGNTSGRWAGDRWGTRLVMRPLYGTVDTGLAATIATTTFTNLGNAFSQVNTAAYTLGQTGGSPGPSPLQVAGPTAGDNGQPVTDAEYIAAFDVIGRNVDLFNLMVLPRNSTQSNADRALVWGPASAFCQRKRAFLIVDPNDDWNDITAAEAGVNQIRIGVATRNAACYWPRLDVGGGTFVDPSGAVAGVMARTDANRGVWKAPAGLEATIRGVTGVERQMSDPENGVINPAALNAIRLFPAGVVSWGARTLVGFNGSGNIDDKYVPVRRTMLMIEESLYRGLRFAVFEPNDEPLWAQIRLAAGSFMNGLFRQGAFAGAKASDAYFVQCDSSTTTPTDINLGIVNVIVGFAPLKPAEFVILTVKQIAGQVQV